MAKSETQVREEIARRLVTEGLPAALEGALRVLRDPKSPAPAVATCATTVLRACGMLDRGAEPDDDKDPSEMTPGELSAIARRAKARLDAEEADSSGSEADATDKADRSRLFD
jgi:hypothetical protein